MEDTPIQRGILSKCLHLFRVETKRKYLARKTIGYSREEIFSVVADIPNYRVFIPFCRKSNIIGQNADGLSVELELGFPPFSDCYNSNVSLEEPCFLTAAATTSRIFKQLEASWQFTKSTDFPDVERCCEVDLTLDVEFRSVIYAALASLIFDSLVEQMEKAFMNEVRRRYGIETIETRPLEIIYVESH